MSEALGAGSGERIDGRLGYRSGEAERPLLTRRGKPEPRMPRKREGRFATGLSEPCPRSEKAPVWRRCRG